MAALQITISTGASTPIYRQIGDQVRLAVATGGLAPGDALPSVRALADRLVINVNTVAKAYAELVRDGVVESQQGLGFFVASKRRQIYTRGERLRRLNQALDTFVHEAVFLDFSAREIRDAVDAKLTGLDLQLKSTGDKA